MSINQRLNYKLATWMFQYSILDKLFGAMSTFFFCFGLKRSQFHVDVLVCLFSWLAMSTICVWKKKWKKYCECYCWKVYRLFPLPVWSFTAVQLSMKPRTRPTVTKHSINNSAVKQTCLLVFQIWTQLISLRPRLRSLY